MADFHQNGNIATLHDLRAGSSAQMTRELESFAGNRRITLVLPSLYSELEAPALDGIVDELAKVRYLHRVVIGLDRADADQYARALRYFSRLPQDHVVIWNDSPRQKAIAARLEAMGLSPAEPGKGRNVWSCLGYILARRDTDVVAIHDCDRHLSPRHAHAAGLSGGEPEFPVPAGKGLLPPDRRGEAERAGHAAAGQPAADRPEEGDRGPRLHRLPARLSLSPVGGIRHAHRHPARPAHPSDWGLEIGVLSEAWRNLAPKAVCQVEIADAYDHKHQDLSPMDAATGLNRMSTDICKAIFRKLAADGTIFTTHVFRTLKATYYRTALDMLESYYHDAAMNGLSIDRHKEEQSIELFAENIMRAGAAFLDNPWETPFIATWSRIHAADQHLMADMVRAVAEDYSALQGQQET